MPESLAARAAVEPRSSPNQPSKVALAWTTVPLAATERKPAGMVSKADNEASRPPIFWASRFLSSLMSANFHSTSVSRRSEFASLFAGPANGRTETRNQDGRRGFWAAGLSAISSRRASPRSAARSRRNKACPAEGSGPNAASSATIGPPSERLKNASCTGLQ